MSSILGQSEAQVFACPKCGEMINTSMIQCAYCNAPVDPQWASWAANAQTTINRAYNDGNYAKVVARAMIIFYLVSFVPFIGVFAFWGFLFTAIAVPVMAARWFFKYQWGTQGIDMKGEEMKQARKNVVTAIVIWGAALFVPTLIRVIFDLPGR